MEGVPEKAIFRSVTLYNNTLPGQCYLLAQIEQVQDTIIVQRKKTLFRTSWVSIVHILYFRSEPDVTKSIKKTIHHIVNEGTPQKVLSSTLPVKDMF